MFVLIILAYLIIGLLEIIPLYKQGDKKELIVYCTLFGFAFVLSLLLSFGVKIPSPANGIRVAVEAIIGKQ
ncbi:hypothetical protein [Abyssisolibacter fermentans]|uniref:hypothetical protein n=1 Tax=Abyssisolibacter fermentans TaxID=1766203 RepID=UPI00082E1BFD|nr:hypothetical protein [Abyssisolibacter fermentans]